MRFRRRRRERGQVLTEYSTVLALFLGIIVAMVFLVTIFLEYGWRVISLVGLEYP